MEQMRLGSRTRSLRNNTCKTRNCFCPLDPLLSWNIASPLKASVYKNWGAFMLVIDVTVHALVTAKINRGWVLQNSCFLRCHCFCGDVLAESRPYMEQARLGSLVHRWRIIQDTPWNCFCPLDPMLSWNLASPLKPSVYIKNVYLVFMHAFHVVVHHAASGTESECGD